MFAHNIPVYMPPHTNIHMNTLENYEKIKWEMRKYKIMEIQK
jgi:hypothetical protein